MKNLYKKIVLAILLTYTISCNIKESQIEPNAVVPSPNQLKYQQMETIGFIHFTVNTFTDKEWGYGDEDPSIFNPTELDVEQWVKVAKSAGLNQLILTAKHHDGFCLWPSKYNEHNIKKSPYKNGKGDIVREFVNACRKHGLKVGVYLSPWDRNHKDYAKPEYITYYRNQLTELLTQYGEIGEIWFDGANGGDGYYGGANETRKIDKDYYDWPNTFGLIRKLQPNILIFGDTKASPDIRWVGNERGVAGKTFWSTIDRDKSYIGISPAQYLNIGEPDGNSWIVGQCDVSIRPGWFYHKSQDEQVKSPQDLVDIYYKSVGRNGVLLLNLPPDKRGLIHKNDIQSLQTFKMIIDETFSKNLANKSSAIANNFRAKNKTFKPQNVLDDDIKTYWATDDSVFPAEITLNLDKEKYFDRIMIQEPIHLGQRVKNFEIEVFVDNEWLPVFEGTTIGYKRLVRINPLKASKIKLKINDATNTVAISTIKLFKSSDKEKLLKISKFE